MRIVALSDTHDHPLHTTWQVPDGDVFIHSGDFSIGRTVPLAKLTELNDQFAALPHKHKLLVAGNHDWPLMLEPEKARELLTALTYLEDSGVTINGVKFYGSPWQPDHKMWAFNLQRGCIELKQKWDAIPDDTDILITHAPPFGLLDYASASADNVGCEALRRRLENISPALHIFGHVHEGRGTTENNGTTFVNAASLSTDHRPVHAPVVIDYDPATKKVTVVHV